jgi:hypothetical protein
MQIASLPSPSLPPLLSISQYMQCFVHFILRNEYIYVRNATKLIQLKLSSNMYLSYDPNFYVSRRLQIYSVSLTLSTLIKAAVKIGKLPAKEIRYI